MPVISKTTISNLDGTITVSNSSIVSINLGNANTWTATQTILKSIGVTSTDGGIYSNTTPAAAGAQQWPPRIHLIGQGWKTNGGGGSQTCDFIAELQTVQNTVSPTNNFVLSGQTNAAGYIPYFTVSVDGANVPVNTNNSFILWASSTGIRGLFGGSSTAFVAGQNTPSAGTDGTCYLNNAGLSMRGDTGNVAWGTSTNPQTVNTNLSKISAGVVGVGTGAVGSVAGSLRLTSITQAIATSGSPTLISFIGSAHTTLTTTAEVTAVNFDFATNGPVQWATGTIASNRWIRIQAPQPSFVGASTITAWSTFDISGGAVTGGANATITNNYAFTIGGATSPLFSINSIGTIVSASTGTFTNLITTSSTCQFNQVQVTNTLAYIWSGRSRLLSPADGKLQLANNAQDDNTDTMLQFGLTTSAACMIKRTKATTTIACRLADDSNDCPITASTFNGAGITSSGSAVTTFPAVSSTLVGIVASSRSTAQTGAVASVAAYTLPASDGSFIVSANVLVTAASNHNFTVTVAYTDEGNTARTLTLSFTLVAGGAFTTAIANANGTVPYMGIRQQIRCKASTSITIATTGTFTSVTYNVEGLITKVN